MNYKILGVISVLLLLKILASNNSQANIQDKLFLSGEQSINIGIEYMIAYPEYIVEIDNNYIFWNDGTKMVINDGKDDKNFEQKLGKPDLKDQISIPYPKNNDYLPLSINYDPGRIRNESFFKKMYGNNQEEVKNNLVTIIWMPNTVNKSIKVTSINGVDYKLNEISKKLDKLPDEVKKYVVDIGGTFSWRYISGSNRLSAHSFGIAIDINTKYANYWKWDKAYGKMEYRNQIPYTIVEIFEEYGFIWGGKWYHYDTMHFEYRPELLL